MFPFVSRHRLLRTGRSAALLSGLIAGAALGQPEVKTPLTHGRDPALSFSGAGVVLGGMGEDVYLAYGDRLHGAELAISRGGAAPSLVRDLAPGAASADLRSGGLVQLGALVFFHATGPGLGRTLWQSDGTLAGTRPVMAVGGDATAADPPLTATSSAIFFVTRPPLGSEALPHTLWVTDGTPAGTRAVKAVTALRNSPPLRALHAVGAHLFFVAEVAEGVALWRTDGTAPGTQHVMLLGGDDLQSVHLTSSGNTLYFAARADSGQQLWKVEETAETPIRLTMLPEGTELTRLAAVQDRVFFANRLGEVEELWRTDDSAAGASAVETAGIGEVPPRRLLAPEHLTPLGEHLVVVARPADGAQREVWSVSASSNPPTAMSIAPSLGWGPASIVGLERRVVYSNSMNQVFSTDASPGGFRTLIATADLEGMPRPLVKGGNFAYGVQMDGSLFRTEGSVVETLPDAPSPPPAWIIDAQLVSLGEQQALFQAMGNVYAATPDGGLELISERRDEDRLGGAGTLHHLGDRILFASGRTLDAQTIESDGTREGTGTLVSAESRFRLQGVLGEVSGQRVVLARHATGNRRPFAVGASGQPLLLADVLVGSSGDERLADGVRLSDRLYFLAASPATPELLHLWVTDGTPAGTQQLSDDAQAPPSAGLIAFQGRLYFPARHPGASGMQLWTSDGTAAGTRRAGEPPALPPGGEVLTGLTVVGDRLYFAIRASGVYGLHLFDGGVDDAGVPLPLITLGEGEAPSHLTAWNQSLAFLKRDPHGVLSLWVLEEDGSIRELEKGDADLALPKGRRLEVIPGGPLFVAASDATGNEPWMSCGDALISLGDLHPGRAASNPAGFTKLGNDIAFLATREDGVQLWTLPMPAPEACAAVVAPGGGTDAGTGADAGVDGGTQADAGQPGNGDQPPATACGCQGAPAPAMALLLLLALARMRSRRARVPASAKRS